MAPGSLFIAPFADVVGRRRMVTQRHQRALLGTV
jgi:hypothetical protein